MKPIFVVDVDGTVCDSSALIDRMTGRFHRVVDSWDDSQMLTCLEEACGQPAVPGSEVLPALMRRGHHVVFLTGRSEGLGDSADNGRRLTLGWLRDILGVPGDVELFMRPRNDSRGNAEAKLDMFERQVMPLYPYEPFVFLDDDTAVLAAYARHGLALKAPECWAALAHFLPEGTNIPA